MTTVAALDMPELTNASRDDECGFGALETAKGVLPLKAMDVQTAITGLAYTLTLKQTFVNALDEAMEASYTFPLPSRAAVSRFRFKVNDRVIDGVLKERNEARREYNEAIQQGHRAALAEEDRPSVFSMKVGNIMPGEIAEVELDLDGQLVYCDGEAEFRFPLVVAPRYIPGVALPGNSVGDGVAPDTNAVPDASRISPPVLLPGFPNPVALSMDVSINGAGLPVSDIGCSLHVAAQEADEEGVTSVKLYPGERLNRDFILRFRIAEDNVTSSLTLVPGKDSKDGTFMLTLVPPANLSIEAKPRDVVFILDRSGSMGAWKMICARRAIGRMVDTLTEKDRFEIMAFDNRIERPPGHEAGVLQKASDRTRFRTVEWLGGVKADGGTEMQEPLMQAMRTLKSSTSDRDRIVVLVTDGQVGQEDYILKQLGADVKSVRFFTLGIGRSVNEGFLQRLASSGGGYCELVESEDRLDDVMVRTHRRIATPVLTDLELSMSNAELIKESITPDRLPDLFVGAPVNICGRYKDGNGRLSVELKGKAGSSDWTQTVSGKRCKNQTVAKLWARWRIRDLEDLVAAYLAPANAEQQITKISLDNQVLCRYTAFVAVDRSETVNEGGKVKQVTQPVESPEGWDMYDMDEECDDLSEIACCMSMDAGAGAPAAPAPAPQKTWKKMARKKMRSGDVECFAPRSSRPSLLGGIVNGISNLFAGSKAEDKELAPLEEPEIMTLEEAIKAATHLLEDLREALKSGTGELAKLLWAKREWLTRIADAFNLFGGDKDKSDKLNELAKELNGLAKQPDSSATVKIWAELEKALEAMVR